MSDELSLTTDEIQQLADRLDGWDELSDRDREVLGGVFVLAGAALASAKPTDEAEVSGFAIASDLPGPGSPSFESFQYGTGMGLRRSGGQGGATGPGGVTGQVYLRFDFKLVAVKTISWAHDD
jgi:hypothetical protein